VHGGGRADTRTEKQGEDPLSAADLLNCPGQTAPDNNRGSLSLSVTEFTLPFSQFARQTGDKTPKLGQKERSERGKRGVLLDEKSVTLLGTGWLSFHHTPRFYQYRYVGQCHKSSPPGRVTGYSWGRCAFSTSATSLVPYRQCSVRRNSEVPVASGAEQCGYGDLY
jgi:hypothetical protein